jgi:hypothetical protein
MAAQRHPEARRPRVVVGLEVVADEVLVAEIFANRHAGAGMGKEAAVRKTDAVSSD